MNQNEPRHSLADSYRNIHQVADTALNNIPNTRQTKTITLRSIFW